jgi:glycosyltransferase involved in cell wall biosynthesis
VRIAVWHNLPSGGGKRALHDHVRGLVERGHTVEAWCPPTADRSYLPLSEIIPEHLVPLEGFNAYLGATGRPLDRIRWNPWARFRSMERHSRACAAAIAAKGFDLLFAGGCRIYCTPPIARFVDLPSVLYLQEPNRYLYEAAPELPWVTSHQPRLTILRATARRERQSALAFGRVLVNSHFSRESVLRSLGVDATVCYLGVDTGRFVHHHQPRERLALSIGSMTPAKNVEFLVHAVARVPGAVRPALVVIANEIVDRYWRRIQDLAERHAVSVQLEHRISDDRLVDLLNRARVMLYAPRLEPFGYAPLEANACGLPVIAVAEGGVRESVEDGVNGLLVEPDAGHMAVAIERLFGDDAFHARLSASAEARAQSRWSLGPAIDRLEGRLLERTAR